MNKTHFKIANYRPDMYEGKKINTACGLIGIEAKYATGTYAYITCKTCKRKAEGN